MKKFKLYLALTLIFCFQSYSQESNKANLNQNIEALIPQQVNDTTPGLVVGVVHKGELIYSKGFGLANLSYGIENDTKMVYNTGSVSKQFLGYAFAMLHAEGKLNIDDPVTDYLDDWPTFEHMVTLRHLLTHTSGYREAYTMSNLAGRFVGRDHLSREECLEVVKKQPELEFVPGSRYTYNSTAWVILAEVLEKVTDTPADVWVEKNILQPLNMNNTQIETYVGEVINNTAESYSYNPSQGYKNEESNRAIFGAAEVYSSIEDLAKWINFYRNKSLGGGSVHAIFLEPFILSNGINTEYALGIGVGSYKGHTRYRHTGGHEAFATQLSYYPEEDLGIITISNYGGKGWLSTEKIADLFLEEKETEVEETIIEPISLSETQQKALTGTYLYSRQNRTIEVSQKNDTLFLNGNDVLIPVKENTFHIKDWEGVITINTNKEGKQQLTAKTSSSHNEYELLEPWTGTTKDLAKYVGDYWSDELETLYHLNLKDDQLSIHHRWLGEIPISPIGDDVFSSAYGYFIKFHRDSNHAIKGLSVNSGRTLNVYFQRN